MNVVRILVALLLLLAPVSGLAANGHKVTLQGTLVDISCATERAGGEPLLSTGLFRNRTSNLGLVTQNIQWLVLMGTAF